MGIREPRSVIQHDSLDDETRVQLWNIIASVREFFDKFEAELRERGDDTEMEVLRQMWSIHLSRPLDEMPGPSTVWKEIKKYILESEWHEAFDILEALVTELRKNKTVLTQKLPDIVIELLNQKFKSHLVGYRFINDRITPIDSAAETDAITGALEDASIVSGTRHALERALEHLADRQSPDYPNSIKESISAVESVVKRVTGKGELSKGLTELENAGVSIHPALRTAWIKIYGWASDEDGIRHGGTDAARVDQALAKYMLVTCSAFISYLVEEGRKNGLLQKSPEYQGS